MIKQLNTLPDLRQLKLDWHGFTTPEKKALGMPMIQKARDYFHSPFFLFKHYVKNNTKEVSELLKLPEAIFTNVLLFLNPAITIDVNLSTLTLPLCYEPLESNILEIKQAYEAAQAVKQNEQQVEKQKPSNNELCIIA